MLKQEGQGAHVKSVVKWSRLVHTVHTSKQRDGLKRHDGKVSVLRCVSRRRVPTLNHIRNCLDPLTTCTTCLQCTCDRKSVRSSGRLATHERIERGVARVARMSVMHHGGARHVLARRNVEQEASSSGRQPRPNQGKAGGGGAKPERSNGGAHSIQ